MERFAEKIVMVTGAGRGQGRAHALRFAGEGAHLVLCDLPAARGDAELDPPATVPYELSKPEDLEETARQVQALGRRAVAMGADVRSLEQMSAVVAEAERALGPIDVLVANAGICTSNPLPTMSVQVWQETIDINLTGVFNACRAVIPGMIERGHGGRVVAIASMAGRAGWENIGHYAASKWGVIGLVKSLALEVAPHGITANVICPSSVNTTMMHNDSSYRLFRPDLENPTREDVLPAFASVNVIPVPYVEPEDISDGVLFLASQEAAGITGATLSISAGVNALNI
ncbi:MAG: short-chain dehydrogenase/reductase [Solirubrobacterales bacterium]|jgi:SDR family mycofactocin-dependent oxidoreductase|nr:short-chain dehydrogenase/reductase [Solirubrobacterales bacterium]MCW3025461.1 short-chain dehydrogenase/reductase [Solirubrobacterales bacterium]